MMRVSSLWMLSAQTLGASSAVAAGSVAQEGSGAWIHPSPVQSSKSNPFQVRTQQSRGTEGFISFPGSELVRGPCHHISCCSWSSLAAPVGRGAAASPLVLLWAWLEHGRGSQGTTGVDEALTAGRASPTLHLLH